MNVILPNSIANIRKSIDGKTNEEKEEEQEGKKQPSEVTGKERKTKKYDYGRISIKKELFSILKIYCETEKIPMSKFLEKLIRENIDKTKLQEITKKLLKNY